MSGFFSKPWHRALGRKLRCRPGDICLVIGQETHFNPLNGEPHPVPVRLGLIVQVDHHDGEVWILREPVRQQYVQPGWSCAFTIEGITDDMLLPLPRDPEPAEAIETPAPAPARIPQEA